MQSFLESHQGNDYEVIRVSEIIAAKLVKRVHLGEGGDARTISGILAPRSVATQRRIHPN